MEKLTLVIELEVTINMDELQNLTQQSWKLNDIIKDLKLQSLNTET